jgi:MFS family permease
MALASARAAGIVAALRRNPTIDAAGGVWALLVGIGLLLMGNGLQASLLGVRADIEDFGSTITGVMMSGYFVGFLFGSAWTPRAVQRVGHIRVFAALAALASIAILVHSLLVHPAVWALMRTVTGLCYAGLYIVAESWLNARSDNATRGRLLSLYMVISYVGMGGGHLTLNVADPSQHDLFMIVSLVISVAVLPILLSATKAPYSEAPRGISLRELYRVSPLGVVGTLATGIANGAVFTMGAVYARGEGLSVAEVSLFMVAVIAGGALFQWPVGKLSDHFDRRLVITGTTFAAAILAVIADRVAGLSDLWLLVAVCAFGGMTLSLYSLCVAYTNDHLSSEQLIAASSGLVLANGIGAILGPSIAGIAMDLVGASGFFAWLFVVHAAIGVFGLWRMTRRPSPSAEDQGPYVAMPSRSSPFVTRAVEEVYAEYEAESADGGAAAEATRHADDADPKNSA